MIYDLDEYFQEGTGPKCFQCTITTYLSIKLLNTINKRVKIMVGNIKRENINAHVTVMTK